MIKLITYTIILTLLKVGYTQALTEVVFAAGGGTKTVGDKNLQYTIGESIVFSTEPDAKFTQGFNQPTKNINCSEIAQLAKKTSPIEICEDKTHQLSLKNGFKAKDWVIIDEDASLVKLSPGTDTYNHTFPTPGAHQFYAIVEYLYCTDTTEIITVNVAQQPTIDFENSQKNLCNNDGVKLITIPTTPVQWTYRQGNNYEPIQGSNGQQTYDALISGQYGAIPTQGVCTSIATKLTVDNSLDNIDIKTFGDQIRTTTQGDSYQWYIIINNQTYAIHDATNQTYTPRFKGRYKVEIKENPCYGVSEAKFYGDGTGLLDAMRYADFLDENTVVLQPREDNSDLQVYPNPSHGAVSISYSGQINQPMQLKLFDLLGHELQSEVYATAKALELNINQPAGIYILQSTIGNQTFTQKLIIE